MIRSHGEVPRSRSRTQPISVKISPGTMSENRLFPAGSPFAKMRLVDSVTTTTGAALLAGKATENGDLVAELAIGDDLVSGRLDDIVILLSPAIAERMRRGGGTGN